MINISKLPYYVDLYKQLGPYNLQFIEINKHIWMPTEPWQVVSQILNLDKCYFKDKKLYTCNWFNDNELNMARFKMLWWFGHWDNLDFNQKINSNTNNYICMLGREEIYRRKFYETYGNQVNGIFSAGWDNKKFESELNNDIGCNNWIKKQLPEEYFSTNFEIVFETSGNIDCISEKTIRPLLFKKPFLVFGFAGIYTELSKYGFKFDKLLYELDTIENINKRYEKFCNIFVDVTQNKRKIKTFVKNNYAVMHKLYTMYNKSYSAQVQQTFNKIKEKIYITKEMQDYLENKDV